MKRFAIVLAGLALLVSSEPAAAQSVVVWRSKTPTGHIIDNNLWFGGTCYAEIRQWNRKLYYFPSVCPRPARNHLAIGVPLYGSLVKTPQEARRVHIAPNGDIVLTTDVPLL